MGIAAARGKYYVQLDSDDRLKPDAVEKLRDTFDSDPAIGMGMPGLKTADGRGICVINNGPRMPDFLLQFETGRARV